MGEGSGPAPVHREFHLQSMGTLKFLQPVAKGAPSGPSLTVELNTGTVGLAHHSVALGSQGAQVDTVWGVIGMLRLHSCSALAVITNAVQVAVLRGHPVYLITGTRVLAGDAAHPDDHRFIKLLSAAVDPAGPGRGLFFSYGADITLSQQAWGDLSAAQRSGPLLERAQREFVWNEHLLEPFTEPITSPVGDKGDTVTHPQPPEMAAFVLPVMLGSVQQLAGLRFASAGAGPAYGGSLTLVARRSTRRLGTRHWRRGADPQGAVANFVETEQLLALQPEGAAPGPGSAVTAAFLQVRGSIPVFWSQIPNAKYKPPTALAAPSAYAPAFDLHMQRLVQTYQGVTAVNLANQHGSEGRLGAAFDTEASRLAATLPGLRLVPFDFHKECGHSRYERLDILWQKIQEDVLRFGYLQQGGPLTPKKQAGVVRSNCIDCLDRTNVVQAWLARRQLEAVLGALGVLGPGAGLASAHPKVEARFKCMWADHGDDISRQYAGMGALKSGFTRTGKRTLGGFLDDGYKSGMRYLLNNYVDGAKQDAFDLVTGTFPLAKDKAVSPFRPQASPLLPALMAVLLLAMAAFNLQGHATNGGWLVKAGLPLGVASVLLEFVVRNGRRLVRRPQLRLDLAQPWAAPPGGGGGSGAKKAA